MHANASMQLCAVVCKTDVLNSAPLYDVTATCESYDVSRGNRLISEAGSIIEALTVSASRDNPFCQDVMCMKTCHSDLSDAKKRT